MKAKKKFGQNFLIDNNIINKISNSINACEDDLIIEIGPGKGALTKLLKEKNAYVLCYEIDTDLTCYLDELLDDKTRVIYNDILLSNIREDIKDIKYNNLYIVGNLPYYITTPIIKYLISLELDIKEMTFMVQKEVADRFTASINTKDYGSITLYLKYYFELKKLFNVSKNCFDPIPKVESAVISLKKRIDNLNVNKDKYFKLISDAFTQKRKTLKNNLHNYNFDKIKDILNKYGLNENIRAEQLEEDVFVDITNNL